MISINELKPGIIFLYNVQPYEVLEVKHLHLGRGGAVLQTKIRNLISGAVLSQNFKPGDKFEEAEISRKKVKYLYNHRGEYWFSDEKNPAERLNLKEEQIGENKNYLKTGTVLDAISFGGRIINIVLPIKIDLKVIEAPPGIKGDRAEGGTKEVILETGAKIKVPLFVEEGDIVRVNTQTGEYVERVKISKS